ncbi:MAG: Gfo/Idh/MocA family oxidoreductase [Candidatus Omnitrophica bacterium]|nr:Gfo/Idh/MocA family oxidoreductase [Candidatus Omnitrophota bacterium]MCM8810256.1 Gfo/Idh/MocA family oxidoreductase [Candidatus Omnitrophota bacterium]
MDKVRIGIIRCGGISSNHIYGVKKLVENGCKEIEITALCDQNKENAEDKKNLIKQFQKNQPIIFTEYEKVISKKICDGFVLCLPHFLHHTIGIELLKNNYHIMIEKPLALTLKIGKKLVKEAKKRNLVLSIAENVRRYLGPRAIKWAIENRRYVGVIRFAHVNLVIDSPFDYTQYTMKWRGVKLLSGGGMIMDSGHHFSDMLLYLFGDVEDVFCEIRKYDERIIEEVPILKKAKADVEDTWVSLIKFKNGIFVNWVYSRSAPGFNLNFGLYSGQFGAIKDKGFVFHPFQNGGDIILKDGKIIKSEEIEKEFLNSLSKEEKEKLFPYNCYDGFGLEWIEFARCIKNGLKPEIDGEGGLKIMALCESCYESDCIKLPVKFKDVYSGKIENYQKEINNFWK